MTDRFARTSCLLAVSSAAAVMLCLNSTAMAVQYLFDRGNGMIYNSWQGRTWLQDSKYIKTLGLDSDGLVTSTYAKSFAENLVYAGLDDWRMPYDEVYSGGDLYMLYGTFNSEWDPPVSKGPFLNIDWKTAYWVEAGGRYAGQWWSYDFGSGPIPSGFHTTSAGDLFGVWPCRSGDVWDINPQLDHDLDNGAFSNSLAGWNAAGGVVDTINYPGTSNTVARISTGSLVRLFQSLDTPADPFLIKFDYDLAQPAGMLSIYLGGVHLGDVSEQHGSLTPAQFEVSTPSLLGLSGTELRFEMDGQSLVAYVDNVRVEPVPEPGMLAIFLLGAMGLIRRPV